MYWTAEKVKKIIIKRQNKQYETTIRRKIELIKKQYETIIDSDEMKVKKKRVKELYAMIRGDICVEVWINL